MRWRVFLTFHQRDLLTTIPNAIMATQGRGHGTPAQLDIDSGFAPSKVLSELQGTFDELAEAHLIPKYQKLDPNLKWGYTGSFKTGKVGNPSKPTFGDPIDLSKFDVDFWIESDILYKKFGSNLRADVEFRKLLSETPGFEGLKPNKQGFSIKFKPSSSN